MAYNRLILDGTLYSNSERFSTSVAFAAADGSAVSSQSALSTWAEAVRALLAPATGYSGTLRTLVGANGDYRKVRAYYYPTVGQPATIAGESTGAIITGSGVQTCPPQCSVVASLLTGVPGRRTRGRMYFPYVSANFSNAGKISGPSTAAGISGAVAQFLGAVADLVSSPAGFGPVVVSEVGGFVTPVTSVSVGDVMDTQRKRRDDMVETRTVTAIP